MIGVWVAELLLPFVFLSGECLQQLRCALDSIFPDVHNQHKVGRPVCPSTFKTMLSRAGPRMLLTLLGSLLLQRRPHAPTRPIPSQMWSKNFPKPDPDAIGGSS